MFDYPDALRAAHVVEQALRECLLLPNSRKLTVETRAKYEADLDRTDADAKELRENLRSDAAERLLEEGGEADSYYLLERLGLEVDPVGGYSERAAAGPADVAELAALLTPSAADHAWALLDDGMRRRPGSPAPDALTNEHFHERVAGALPVLAGARHSGALVHCVTLLLRHAEETALVTSYLSAMADDAATEVRKICSSVLASDSFMLGWQRAWLWNTLAKAAPAALGDAVLGLARRVAESDGSDWIERLEAVKVLAAAGVLERGIPQTLWQRAPEVYRADLIAAVVEASLAPGTGWPERFLTTARRDPVHAVVQTNVRSTAKNRRTLREDDPPF